MTRESRERTPEAFFAGHPEGLAVFRAVAEALAGVGDVDVQVTVSQIAFRHRRGFAYVWRPGQYVRGDVPAVLSFALGREVTSARVKEVAHPAPSVWMHHVELRSPSEVDGEVRAWLAEARRWAEGDACRGVGGRAGAPPDGAAGGARPDVEVRPAQPDDVPAVCRFGQDYIPEHYAPLIGAEAAADQVRHWWNCAVIADAVGAGLVVVAEMGGEVVGVGQRGRSGEDHALYKLYVRPGLRGRGVGRRMLDSLVDALPPDAERVFVEHFAANTRAGAFYEREGFGIVRVEPNASGDPRRGVVWRCKELDAPSGDGRRAGDGGPARPTFDPADEPS